jgi:dienelactone hydrolase
VDHVDVGGTPIRTWVVHPERSGKAPVVIVIHEIFGLTDWVRGVADQLAAEGFLAVRAGSPLRQGQGRRRHRHVREPRRCGEGVSASHATR